MFSPISPTDVSTWVLVFPSVGMGAGIGMLVLEIIAACGVWFEIGTLPNATGGTPDSTMLFGRSG